MWGKGHSCSTACLRPGEELHQFLHLLVDRLHRPDALPQGFQQGWLINNTLQLAGQVIHITPFEQKPIDLVLNQLGHASRIAGNNGGSGRESL